MRRAARKRLISLRKLAEAPGTEDTIKRSEVEEILEELTQVTAVGMLRS